MSAYYIMLAGLSLCGALLCVRNRSRLKDGLFLLISFVALLTMSAIRYDVGYDYSMVYSPDFERIIADPTGAYLAGHRFEPGFKMMLSWVFGITPNFHMPFVIISIIIISLVMLYFWLYSPNPFVSVFLFVALGQYYCSMNFMRQMIAAVIAMYAFPLIKKRNLLSALGYLALTLLAASFHRSALILIPFFFINLIPVNKYTLGGFAAVTLVIYFNTHRIIGFVTQYWYTAYGLDNIHMKVPLPPHFTIAVSVVFLVIFLNSKRLLELDRRNYLYINYAFFTVFFVFMGTRHSILDRFSMYFQALAPVGIAIIFESWASQLKEESSAAFLNRKAAPLVLLALTVLVNSLVTHHIVLLRDHHGVVPYKIIFNQPFYKSYVDSIRRGSNTQAITEPEDAPLDISMPPMPEQEPGEIVPPQSAPETDDGVVAGQEEQAMDGNPAEVSLEDLFK